MRGADRRQDVLCSYSLHALVEPILTALSPRFQTMYSTIGRPSIPPEQMLRALLLQILYTLRSERQLMEQVDYNVLFRGFAGLTPDEAVRDPTVFTKNRDRLLAGTIAAAFRQAVLRAVNGRALLSHEHFSVDASLLEAWASQKSFRPKDEPSPPPSDDDPSNPMVNVRKE